MNDISIATTTTATATMPRITITVLLNDNNWFTQQQEKTKEQQTCIER